MLIIWSDGNLNSLRPSDTYICISKLNISDSDYGLSPGQHQAIIWTNGGKVIIWPLGTNFSELLIEIDTFYSIKFMWKHPLWNGAHFALAMSIFATFQNDPWKFTNVKALTVIFHVRSCFGDYEKTRNLYWLTCLDLPICQIWWL